MNRKPVVVKWIDITSKSGWLSSDDVDDFVMDDKENVVMQCGFLYEEDEKQIVLLNSYFEALDLIGDVTKIPKQCVLDILYL